MQTFRLFNFLDLKSKSANIPDLSTSPHFFSQKLIGKHSGFINFLSNWPQITAQHTHMTPIWAYLTPICPHLAPICPHLAPF